MSLSKSFRVVEYIALGLCLVVGRVLSLAIPWHYSARVYVINEFAIALIALFVGLLALVRFFTKQNIVFLFIGTGFIGATFLDGYQAIVSGLIDGLWLPTDSWNVSSTFIAVLLTGSWVAWRREKDKTDSSRLRGPWLYASFFWAASAILFFLSVLPPHTAQPIYSLGRIEIFVSSTFSLVALMGYLDKGHWRHDSFEHWLVLSLILNLAANILFIPFSLDWLDVMFTVGHLLKQSSYLLCWWGCS